MQGNTIPPPKNCIEKYKNAQNLNSLRMNWLNLAEAGKTRLNDRKEESEENRIVQEKTASHPSGPFYSVLSKTMLCLGFHQKTSARRGFASTLQTTVS